LQHASATPASSPAPFSAPAEVPTTRSKQAVSPSSSIAAVMPAETTPRIPAALDRKCETAAIGGRSSLLGASSPPSKQL
jgi:hypothetical protein